MKKCDVLVIRGIKCLRDLQLYRDTKIENIKGYNVHVISEQKTTLDHNFHICSTFQKNSKLQHVDIYTR